MDNQKVSRKLAVSSKLAKAFASAAISALGLGDILSDKHRPKAPYRKQPGEGHKRAVARLIEERKARAPVPMENVPTRQQARAQARLRTKAERSERKFRAMKTNALGGAAAVQ